MEKFNDFIDDNFYGDYHNWVLWCPVIFALGVLSYFKFEYYNLILLLSLLAILLLFVFIFKKNVKVMLILSVFLLFLAGYFRTGSYVKSLMAPTVKYKLGYVKIYGTIEDFSYYQKSNKERKRILVKVDKIEKVKKQNKMERVRNEYTSYFDENGIMHNQPKYVRININNKTYKPKYGDYVEVSANLMPIPKQAFHGAYNVERNFYFQQIGGIGYNGYIKKHSEIENKNIFSKLRNKAYNLREKINNKIIDATNEENGTLLGSFITGIRGRIKEENYNVMTDAGLSHIIAISGLNMAIVMGIVFAAVRRILVQSEYLALNFNIKKFSAIFAIVFGFLYLNITGFPVSANRAYIMSVLFFVGIILDRETDTMRFLAFTALILLFYEPNLIFDVGFQLSFLAVIGLMAGFRTLKEFNINTFTSNKFLKPFYYLFTILMSSIFAEISVLPLLIYSFNSFTPYNLLTNMFAIPLSSIITIPFATFSILLFPFHLEKILLVPASFSLNLILKLSKIVVDLPNSVMLFQSPPIFALSLMIIGFLWFCLWGQKWRYFGVILFILGILFSFFKENPDVIIDRNDKIIIIVSNNKELYISNDKNAYKISAIEKKFGQNKHYKLEEFCKNNNENCLLFVKNVDQIFKNKDIINNFIELNSKYKIFDKDYKILQNIE